MGPRRLGGDGKRVPGPGTPMDPTGRQSDLGIEDSIHRSLALQVLRSLLERMWGARHGVQALGLTWTQQLSASPSALGTSLCSGPVSP